MARQASAQRRQEAAQRLQWSMSCASHCFSHQSQMSAHSLHICLANGLLRAIASAHNRQIAEHSMQQAGQSFFALGTDHVRKTVAALGRAEVTGVDAVFGELV